MLQFFLNPWMLAGLAGIALPVLAHLLSKKKYDTVDWGAMQFLELDPSARRNLRLEDLLLLAIRMSMMALLAIALARPWIGGAWLGRWASSASRDVVIVLDGSYSMGWDGKSGTPRANSIRLARQLISDLRAGDTVTIVEAREQPRLLLPGPTRDREKLRRALDELPPPSGTANLYDAMTRGIQILATGTNVERELVVLSDNQTRSWKPDDKALWARLDDLTQQSTVPPRLWAVDAAQAELGNAANFTIQRLRLSRELAVPGVPVRFSTTVKFTGGKSALTRDVFVEVDGQRLADQTLRLNLAPDGEASVEFEHAFEAPGSHRVSVVLDSDSLVGDNRSDAIIVVADSLPVLLVDGDRQRDPTRSETFFAGAALTAAGAESSWIRPTILTPGELTADALRSPAVVVLANLASIPAEIRPVLTRAVASGTGLLFTLGDKVPAAGFPEPDPDQAPLFPAVLQELVSESREDSQGVRVAGNSLELPWLREFRSDRGGTLTDARFSRWWKMTLPEPVATIEQGPALGTPVVIARLTSGDPWIVTRRFDRGATAVLTSSLDADWNTLPARTDYVPWLHELLFSLASTATHRNVDVGMPLVLNIAPGTTVADFEFRGPAGQSFDAREVPDELHPAVILPEVTFPGLYRFTRRSNAGKPAADDQYFVANFDRAESDLTALSAEQKALLATGGRLTFAESVTDLQSRMIAGTARAEIWWLLIYGFLAFLSLEVWMTRRMLRGAPAPVAT